MSIRSAGICLRSKSKFFRAFTVSDGLLEGWYLAFYIDPVILIDFWFKDENNFFSNLFFAILIIGKFRVDLSSIEDANTSKILAVLDFALILIFPHYSWSRNVLKTIRFSSNLYIALFVNKIEIFFERFQARESVSGVSQVKSSVQRGIKTKLVDQFPPIDDYIAQIFPKKEPLVLVKWWVKYLHLLGLFKNSLLTIFLKIFLKDDYLTITW